MKKASNQYVTVTRTDYDTFTYQHSSDKVPIKFELQTIFRAAQASIEAMDRANEAISFFRDSLARYADTGKKLDEYGIRGASAICWALTDMFTLEHEGFYKEFTIIQLLAAGEVK